MERTPLSVAVTTPRVIISGHVSSVTELNGLSMDVQDARALNEKLAAALALHDRLYPDSDSITGFGA